MGKKEEKPPEGLSPAQLRAWNRRQKILARGEKGIESITNARNSVAEASKKEVEERLKEEAQDEGEQEDSKQDEQKPSSSDEVKAAEPTTKEEAKKDDKKANKAPEAPKLAKWEQKWKSKAEKAPEIEVEFKAPVEVPRTPEAAGDDEETVQTNSELRQRKNKPSADASKTVASGDEPTDQASETVLKLKEKLRVQKWSQREMFLRQALLIASALAAGAAFAKYGGLVSPSTIVGHASQQDSTTDETEDFKEGEFEIETDDDVTSSSTNAGENELMLNMIEPPLGGWLSIPLGVFFIRIMVHFTLSFIGQYPFAPSSTVAVASSSEGSGLPFPLSLVSSFSGMVPGLSAVMQNIRLVQAVASDVVFVLVIFIVSSAGGHILLNA